MALGWACLFPPLSSGGALVARPWLRFHTPLIEPDVRIGRVAQPLLAFAPTDPTVRRYRSGLFRKDPRRVDDRLVHTPQQPSISASTTCMMGRVGRRDFAASLS